MILRQAFKLILWFALCMQAGGAAPEDGSYVLRPNDTIKLEIYDEPDLSASVRILRTGEASFPLIGSLKVSGMSVSTATSQIREMYAKDYLVDPKVSLTVEAYAVEFILIIGAVKSPGQIPIPVSGHLDLATAIATVGGLAENADVNKILLVRASGTNATFTMAQIGGDAGGRVKLEPGDRIIVHQSAFVGKSLTILGQVGRQGPMAFPVNGRLDLVAAVAMAGGLTELANPRKVTINRKGKITQVDYKEISQKGDQPFLLQPDDIITVAERLF